MKDHGFVECMEPETCEWPDECHYVEGDRDDCLRPREGHARVHAPYLGERDRSEHA